MKKRDFETYQKRFWDFEILPNFSETHVFKGTINFVTPPDSIHDWGEGVLSILWRFFTERSLPWNFYALTQVSAKID